MVIFLVCVLTMAIAGILRVAGVNTPKVWRIILFVPSLIGAPLLIIALLRTVANLRNVQKARAAGCRKCPNCMYSLVGSDPNGCCPECGQAYTQDALVAYWKVEVGARSLGSADK